MTQTHLVNSSWSIWPIGLRQLSHNELAARECHSFDQKGMLLPAAWSSRSYSLGGYERLDPLSSRTCLLPSLSGLKASLSGLLWSRHTGRQMIARTILPFLLLDQLIIHMHIEANGRQVLVPQKLLKAKGIIAEHKVAQSKRMTKDVRTDAFVGNACTLTNALEEQAHAIGRERQSRLGEKHVDLPGTTP